jgi:hypothetical protein
MCGSSVRVAPMREGRCGGLRRVPGRAQDRGTGRRAVRRRRPERQGEHAGQGPSVPHPRAAHRLSQS